MDKAVSALRHYTMSQIKSKNTSIEEALRKALWREGIRYRKNLKTLPGKPDIAITKYKIAIFCDGEFWHGKDWETKKGAIKSNREYWIPKIERTIARDAENDSKLANLGWVVYRFWGNEINTKLLDCVDEIKEVIYTIKSGMYTAQQEYALDLLAAESEDEYTFEYTP